MPAIESIIETIRKEFAVIRGAPFSFFSLAAVCFSVSLGMISWSYSVKIGNLESDNANLRDKLSSVPATLNRNANTRDGLLRFYSGYHVLVQDARKGKFQSLADLTSAEMAWENGLEAFVTENLGPAASDRISDMDGCMMTGLIDLPDDSEIGRRLSCMHRNLQTVIETAAYDR